MLRTRVQFTGGTGLPGLSTMYWDGTEDQAGADAAIAHLDTFWTALEPRMANDITWTTEAEVAVISNLGIVTEFITTTPVIGSGSDAAARMALATQGLIRWTTPAVVNNRRLRGRTFVPGPTTASNSDGVPTAAYMTAVGNAAATLNAATGPQLAIVSFTHAANATVNGTSVWSNWAVLRSRRD